MTVYVVQVPERRNPVTKIIEPLFDLSPAQDFGEVVVMLSPTTKPFSPAGVVRELRNQLEEYCDEDYLLCTGNPILIGMASAIAADMNDGIVNWLQWNRGQHAYIAVRADLN